MGAFVVSVVSICVAGASLWWQVKSWRDSGPKVQASFVTAILGDSDRPFTGIEVTNSGRSPTVVQSVGARLPSQHRIQLLRDALGQVSIPLDLEPGASKAVYFQPGQIESTLKRAGFDGIVGLKPMAMTGHGVVLGRVAEFDPNEVR